MSQPQFRTAVSTAEFTVLMPDSVEGRLNLGNGDRPHRKCRDGRCQREPGRRRSFCDLHTPNPPNPGKLFWQLGQVDFKKMGTVRKNLKREYLDGYDRAYGANVGSREPTSGGGDSDPTGEIVADADRAFVRERLMESYSLTCSAVRKILEGWDELKQAESRAASGPGMRVRAWDAAELRAASAKSERRRV